ncbi:hypothetical protein T484DRAFT_1959583 [Baffinella frigidus]|nr:hypothetical protein T484DRAFT_1959583 [Cryptophyta sp. CCMP2293]
MIQVPARTKRAPAPQRPPVPSCVAAPDRAVGADPHGRGARRGGDGAARLAVVELRQHAADGVLQAERVLDDARAPVEPGVVRVEEEDLEVFELIAQRVDLLLEHCLERGVVRARRPLETRLGAVDRVVHAHLHQHEVLPGARAGTEVATAHHHGGALRLCPILVRGVGTLHRDQPQATRGPLRRHGARWCSPCPHLVGPTLVLVHHPQSPRLSLRTRAAPPVVPRHQPRQQLPPRLRRGSRRGG